MAYSIEKVSANLRMLRAQKHVTQLDVARATGISHKTICKYENGECGMSLYTASKLAEYYGVPIDQLVGRQPYLCTS